MKFFMLKKWFILSLVLIAYLFQSSAKAEGIKNINLLEGEYSAFNKIPVYSQGGIGICFAYVSSVLLDYYRLTHGQNFSSQSELSSPLWLAYLERRYGAHRSALHPHPQADYAPLDSGYIDDTFLQISQRGFLNRSDMNEGLKNFLNDFSAKTDPEAAFIWIETLMGEEERLSFQAVDQNAYPSESSLSLSLPAIYSRPILEPTVQKYTEISTYNFFLLQSITPTPPLAGPTASPTPELPKFDLTIPYPTEDLTLASDHTDQVTPNSMMTLSEAEGIIIQQLLKKYTDLQHDPSESPQKIEFLKSILLKAQNNKDGLWGYINTIFSPLESQSHKAPNSHMHTFSIEKSSRQTFDGFIKVIDDELNQVNPQPIGVGYCSSLLTTGEPHLLWEANCDHHAGVIVGQRVILGNIQYLIQNSWGNSCRVGYSSKWECVEGQGALWVDGGDLYNSTDSLYWLSDH